jgi:hypothetical protein
MVIRVERGKGNKDRQVVLCERLLKELRQCWKRYRPERYLFEGKHRGQPIEATSVQRAFRTACKKAGYDGTTVVFRYRDRADANRSKLATLDAQTFCRRFLHHVLPKRFVRIRRYGLLSNRVRKPLLAHCRQVLRVDPPLRLAPPGESRREASLRIFGTDPQLCPTCKLGTLVVRAQWRPTRLPLDAVLATLQPRAP